MLPFRKSKVKIISLTCLLSWSESKPIDSRIDLLISLVNDGLVTK